MHSVTGLQVQLAAASLVCVAMAAAALLHRTVYCTLLHHAVMQSQHDSRCQS